MIFIGTLIFVSLIFNHLFERTKVPNVLFLLIIGLLIGPVFHLVSPDDLGRLGRVFTSVTLIAILYESGTRLHIYDLTKAVGAGSMLAVLNFIIPIGVGIGIGHYALGMDLLPSAFLGACVGSISTPIVLPMLNQLGLGEKAKNIIFIEAAMSDVICLVGTLALLDAITIGSFNAAMTLQQMVISFVLGTSIGLVAGLFWMGMRRAIVTKIQNSKFTSFALAFILYGGCEMLNINGGMAVLAFGFMMGNVDKFSDMLEKYFPEKNFIRRKNPLLLEMDERNFFQEIVFILTTFFFVYIGMSIQLYEPDLILVGLVFISIMFVVRIPTIMLLGRKGLAVRDKVIMSILTPKGLVSAVLASLPLQHAVTEQQVRDGQVIQSIGYASILFSIVIFSLLIFGFEKATGKKRSQE